MGFYYNSGDPPPDDDKPATLRETITIIWAAFSVLAIPLALLMGVFAALIAVIWLFTIHPLAGLGAILVIVAALVVRGVWEAKHPPDLS
ncbi:MAG TPA: hypothetical protein VIH05_10370 [Tepidiformaceae bacterium]